MDTAIECPLVCLTNDTGTNDISFEWKKKIIFSGVCGAPEKELAAVTYSPFRRGIEIKVTL